MMRRFLLFSVFIIMSFSAQTSYGFGYGPPEDHSKFTSAKIARFGKIGVFTFHKLIYRPARGIRAFPDGGIPKYLVDHHYIAVYDFKTEKARIIRDYNNIKSRWFFGSGGFFVVRTFGDKVIINLGGQRRKDYKYEDDNYWLDLKSGKLTLLPIRKELASHGRDMGYMYLVDEKGTLIFVCPPLGSNPGWIRAKDSNKELWIRYPSGKYERIAEVVHYYGFKDNSVHFWTTDRSYQVYDLTTKKYRPGDRREYPAVSSDPKKHLQLDVDFSVHYDNGHKLHYGKKVNGQWHYENLPVEINDLVP